LAIAHRAVDIASDKQASDILLLDLRAVCQFADYFVLCNGESEPQIKTICEDLDVTLHREGVALLHREGTPDSGWVLMDFGDVIVHVFHPEQRAFYRLEQLWGGATPLLRIL
jgi:ribosome-associated protein